MTYEELVPLAIAGDQDAYTEIYNRLKDYVQVTAYRFFNKDLDAQEEFVHKALTQILLNLHRFDSRSKFTTWTYRICFNQACERIRRNKKHYCLTSLDATLDEDTKITLGDTISDLRNDYNAVEAKLDIEKILVTITPRRRKILEARFLEGLTHEEIVQKGISRSTGAAKSVQVQALREAKKNMNAGREITLTQTPGSEVSTIAVVQPKQSVYKEKQCACGCEKVFTPTAAAMTHIPGHSKVRARIPVATKHFVEEAVVETQIITQAKEIQQTVPMVAINIPVSAVDKLIAMMPAHIKAQALEQWLQEV